jgi:hypothetical protein
MIVTQTKTQPIAQYIGHLARSFFRTLEKFAIGIDELPQSEIPVQIGLQYLTTMGHHMKESFYD